MRPAQPAVDKAPELSGLQSIVPCLRIRCSDLAKYPMITFRTTALRFSALQVLSVVLILAVVGVVPHSAHGQLAPGGRYLQAGLAVIPGIGAQASFLQPSTLYTVEGALYVDFSPQFSGGEGSIQVSGGIGGALRIFGIARAIGNAGSGGTDLDVGFRFGPALYFPLGESSRAENPFSLFLDPYGRFITELGGNRIGFVELGLQRPILRAGLVFNF